MRGREKEVGKEGGIKPQKPIPMALVFQPNIDSFLDA